MFGSLVTLGYTEREKKISTNKTKEIVCKGHIKYSNERIVKILECADLFEWKNVPNAIYALILPSRCVSQMTKQRQS